MTIGGGAITASNTLTLETLAAGSTLSVNGRVNRRGFLDFGQKRAVY